MSEIEYAWVIRRDDGKFYVTTTKSQGRTRHIYDNRLLYALRENCQSESQETIDVYKLQNCRPVKIEMRVVENEENK